jgi:hypothetical protein
MKTEFELAIEKETGESVESIREVPIDQRRRLIERKFKRKMRFLTESPLVGRGNVHRDQTIDSDDVEAELDEALRA